MSRVVLDAHALASCALAPPGSPLSSILDAWQEGVFSVAVSAAVFQEVIRVLHRPYFTERLGPEVIAQYLWALHWRVTLVPITDDVDGIASTAENDLALATAVSAAAQYVVTSDEVLLRLGWYRGVALLDARSFAELPPTAWRC